MKFRKNWKQFWTLDRHHAEGFTLVELIVVIAILAILGGVAVPAYGGYVKKANKTADQTLVSEVANALTLYYYTNPSTTGAYVVLSTSGVTNVDNNNAGADAMKAAFGDNWNAAALKFGEWDQSGTLASGLNSEGNIAGTGFEDTSKLMGQVSNVTSQFIANQGQDKDAIRTYLSAALGDELLNEVAKETNTDLANANSQQLANLAVLAVAKEKQTNGNSQISGVMDKYAMYTAMANATEEQKIAIFGDSAKADAFEQQYNNIMTGDPSDNMEALETEYGYAIDNYMDDEVCGSLAADNTAAYESILAAVAGASESKQFSAEDLAQEDFYYSDAVTSKIGAYTSASSLRELGLSSIAAGEVVVFLTFDANGAPVVYCSSYEALLK